MYIYVCVCIRSSSRTPSDLVPVEVCISVDFSNSVFFFLFPPSLPVLAMAFITRLLFMHLASVPARFACCGAVGINGRGRRRRGRLTFGSPIRCRRSADDQPSCHTRKLFHPPPNNHLSTASLRLGCKIFNIKILTPTQTPLPGFTARLYGGFL